MANGVVVRFDSKRGYGFINPDDGGEDVFVHQNNIVMEGFRFLKVGERVAYELEVGEKGMKAVSVSLLEPRAAGERPDDGFTGGDQQGGGEYGGGGNGGGRREYGGGGGGAPRGGGRREYGNAPRREYAPRGGGGGGDDAAAEVQRLRRKQERLVSLLVEKGLLQPGEFDALDAAQA